MAKANRRRLSKTQIRTILTELEESGLSQRDFASNHNLPLSTLTNWLRKHRSADTTARTQDVISVGILAEPPPSLEIEFPGGEVLRISAGCLGEDLRAVLAELRRC